MAGKWWRVLWQALGMVALVLAIGFWQTRNLVTGVAPPLAGRGVNGEVLDLAAYRGGPVVVHFWASWCPVCRIEQDSIAALAGHQPVLTVAMQSGEASELASYLREHDVDFPVMVDADGALAARFGVRAVPTTFVIDGDGNIRFREVGYTTGWGLRLRMWAAS